MDESLKSKIFKVPLETLDDEILLETLDLVSSEIKRRNSLMVGPLDSTQDAVQKIVEVLKLNPNL